MMKKDSKKGHHLKPLLLAALVILVAGILVNACGSDDKDDSPKKADTSSEQKKEKKEEEKSFTVGDTAEYKDVQVTLNGIEKSEGSEFNKPADGKIFVTAEFTITNNSDEDLLISSIGNFEAYFDGLASTLDVGATADLAGKKTQLDGSVCW